MKKETSAGRARAVNPSRRHQGPPTNGESVQRPFASGSRIARRTHRANAIVRQHQTRVRPAVRSTTILVIAGMCPPFFQPPPSSVNAAMYQLGHLPERHDLASAKCFQRFSGNRTWTPFHRTPPGHGQVYDIAALHSIYLSIRRRKTSLKRQGKVPISPA